MSLIHWWPLNGNIKDNGVDNFTLSATPSFNAAGKIGKCATNTNINAGLTYLSNQTLPLAKDSPISIFTWVYMNDYSTTGANLNGLVSNHNHGHNGDKGSGFGLNLRNNGNSFQVSISTSSTGGRTFSTYCGNTIFSAGEWHHVGFTYNGSRINFYLDGKYDGGLNFTSSYNSNNPIGIFCWSTGYPEYSSSCQLNDVRIYNHALSAKEVKEISKGLVLHYNFEDEYIEPTTNLFGGRTDFSNTNHWSRSQINATAPTIDTNGNMVLYGAGTDGNYQSYTVSSNGGYITISPSTTYTLSVYVKYSSTNAYFNMYFYERTDSAAVKTNVQRLGCTADEVGKWVLRKLTVTTQSTTTKMYTELNCYKCLATETIVMKNNTVQLEQKDHATPYVNETRNAGKVYDNSGHGYNGTVTGFPRIDSTTSSGQHSIYFPASNVYIKLPVLNYSGFANSYTFSWWAKKTDMNDSMAWGFADGNRLNLYPTGSVICWNTGDGSSNQFKSNGSSIKYSQWNNNWHLFTVTGNGTVTKLYVDGQEVGTAATYKALTGTQIYISGWDASVNYKWIGNIADFKIYATVLSADDIKAEYNRKAAIDKNGNLFTGEIIETAGSAAKIDKNSFIDSNLFATTMTLEDGSTWAPICVHYIPDGMFTGANQTFYYTGRNIWENFGAINDLERPESNQWEFYVMQQSTINGAFSKYRFKQNVSPLSATWDQVNPSKVGTNVTRISATSTNNYAGMYWFNTSNIAMCFANTSNGNWFGCGARTYWGDDYTPGYNGEQVRGWQLVYMRISRHKARMFKNSVIIPTDVIEN